MTNLGAPFYTFDKPGADAFMRLGAAIVYRWDELPKDVQALLLEQSVLIGGGNFPTEGSVSEQKARTLDFIEKNKRSTFTG